MSREIKQAERPDSVKVLPSNFTPGPWTIEEYGDNDTPNLVIHEDSESRICFMATPGSHGDPAIIEANARLIAAAPDLLAALQGMVEIHGGLGVSMQVAIVAIAKATGTS